MCNPPFFDSPEEAGRAASKKWTKLGKAASPTLNFGGQANELWTPGGEPDFLRRMIRESVEFAKQVGWFTGRHGITDVEVINIGQGGKKRRVLAWRVR